MALESVLKPANCPTARDFFANQGGLTLAYFAYGKEIQRKAAEKDSPFGRFDIFQTRPKNRARFEPWLKALASHFLRKWAFMRWERDTEFLRRSAGEAAAI